MSSASTKSLPADASLGAGRDGAMPLECRLRDSRGQIRSQPRPCPCRIVPNDSRRRARVQRVRLLAANLHVAVDENVARQPAELFARLQATEDLILTEGVIDPGGAHLVGRRG